MNTTTTISRISLTGVGGFVLAAALTGALTHGYDARREAISALAALDAPHAWLMITGFVLAAAGLVAGGLALWQSIDQRAGRIGAALVAVAGVLVGVAGFARQDCSEQLTSCVDHGEATGASTSYWVHQNVSMLAFLLLIVASFLVARGLTRTGRASLAVAARVAGAVAVVTIVLLVVEPPFVHSTFGLVQRLFAIVLLGWPAVAAVVLTRANVHGRAAYAA